jgi:hypothetical protein
LVNKRALMAVRGCGVHGQRPASKSTSEANFS